MKSNYYIATLLMATLIISCEDPKENDKQAPSIQISFPANLSVVSELVKIKAQASDNDAIDNVIFFIDGVAIDSSTDRSDPYEYNWLTVKLANGSIHTVSAKAVDKSGNVGLSQIINVTVNNSSATPQQVNLNYRKYECSNYKLYWTISPDADFKSYTIYKSNSVSMTNPETILTTTNIADTSLIISDIPLNETRYFNIVVTDIFGLKSNGFIKALNNVHIAPTKIEIQTGTLLNGIVSLKWNKSKNCDFKSYTLRESLNSDMSNSTEIFNSNAVSDTIFTISNFPSESVKYYSLTVKDLFDFSTASSVKSVSSKTIPMQGLLLSYKFSNNANDDSGNNYNGTINGAALVSDRHGNLNSAYLFNGNSNINSGDIFNNLQFPISVSIWLKTADLISSYRIFLSDDNSDLEQGYSGFWMTSNSGIIDIGYGDGTIKGSQGRVDVLTSNTVNTTNWTHVVGVYKSTGNFEIYINSEKVSTVSSGTSTSPIFHYSAPFVLGKKALSGDYGFNGSIDDFRIYNRVLTQSEINQLYQEK